MAIFTTKLFVKETPTSDWRLMNAISYSSKFFRQPMAMLRRRAESMKGEKLDPVNSMADPVLQLVIARHLRDEWKLNGPWPKAQFRITQGGDEVKG